MNTKHWSLAVILTVLIVCSSCGSQEEHENSVLRISGAASLTDVMQEISHNFENFEGKKNKAIHVHFFASSGSIAKEIEAGHNTDLYVTADPEWMQYLLDKQLIETDSVKDLCSNSLILITTKDSKLNLSDVEDLKEDGVNTIALGDPSHVPAGNYARTALKNAGVWNEIQSKVIGAEDVRAVLALVANGSVDAGIVYATDLPFSTTVRKAFDIPENITPPITYHAGIVKGRNNNIAREFMQYLFESNQRDLLKKHGFQLQ